MKALEELCIRKCLRPEVKSCIPGRLRLAFGKFELLSNWALPYLRYTNSLLEMLEGVREVQINARIGTVLIYMDVSIPAHGDTETEVSRGSCTTVHGRTVRVGNLAYMEENGVTAADPLPDSGAAIGTYVGLDSSIIGAVSAADQARERMYLVRESDGSVTLTAMQVHEPRVRFAENILGRGIVAMVGQKARSAR